jgi:methyl-accepting chemotaxis protein
VVSLSPFSIGKKLLLGVGLPALLVVVAGATFYWEKAERLAREATRDQALALAELISNTFALTDPVNPQPAAPPAAATPHRSVSDTLRASWKPFRYVASARVIDRQGKIRWSRQIEEVGQQHPEAARLLQAQSEGVRFEDAEVVRPLGGAACAGCHTGETVMHLGTLQLMVDEPALKRDVSQVMSGALTSVLVLGVFLCVATGLSIYLVVRRPLKRLTRVMQRAEQGDFVVRAETNSSDEIGALSRAFNQMLARITAMKADEIDTHRDLAAAHEQLALKQQLEETNDQLSRRVTELTTLYDVSRSLTSTL